MKTWKARMRLTFSASVEVIANSEEEAREKLRAGKWDWDQCDELVDWGDPTGLEEET